MLTIDDDIQFYVQQQFQQARTCSGADTVSAYVLDAKTGEVSGDRERRHVDPSQDIERNQNRELATRRSPRRTNRARNKVITALRIDQEYELSASR